MTSESESYKLNKLLPDIRNIAHGLRTRSSDEYCMSVQAIVDFVAFDKLAIYRFQPSLLCFIID